MKNKKAANIAGRRDGPAHWILGICLSLVLASNADAASISLVPTSGVDEVLPGEQITFDIVMDFTGEATLGGVCLNVGCIPSKALLHVARVIDEAADLAEHGVKFGRPKLDLDKLRGFKESVVARLTGGLATMAGKRGVEVVRGEGRLTGANEITVFTRIVLPLVWPGFLTVGLVVGLAVWGEFQLALIFIQDPDAAPVTTSYFKFTQRFGRDWSLTSAGAVMMILPVLVLFLAMQRRFVEGLTQGGAKM